VDGLLTLGVEVFYSYYFACRVVLVDKAVSSLGYVEAVLNM
jgi:hypothetical protein